MGCGCKNAEGGCGCGTKEMNWESYDKPDFYEDYDGSHNGTMDLRLIAVEQMKSDMLMMAMNSQSV